MMSRVQDQRVLLVTGAGGFLGGYIADEFNRRGWRVIGIDLIPKEAIGEFRGAAYHQLDVRDEAIGRLLKSESPTACVHCAGSASVPLSMKEPRHDFHCNAVQTIEVLEAIRTFAPGCLFVLLSSAAVYGSPDVLPICESSRQEPISAYGYHKRVAEQLCAEYAALHGVATACARIFSAYGPGLQRQVLWDLCEKLMAGGDLMLQGTGEESRDFVHAIDIAQAVATIVDRAAFRGEAYNIGSGVETSISSLAEMLVAAMGSRSRIVFDGNRPSGTPVRWRADIGRLAELGYAPSMSIDRGVAGYVEWAKPILEKF